MKILRIVSGGQTGADRMGLDAAIQCKIPYGGWCPHGRRSEDGTVPEQYILKETGSSGYLVRTQLNVTCSSATVVFTHGKPGPGSQQTIEFANALKRPCLHVDLDQLDDNAAFQEIMQWLQESFGEKDVTLNVAGSRESSHPGIGSRVKNIMVMVLCDAGKTE